MLAAAAPRSLRAVLSRWHSTSAAAAASAAASASAPAAPSSAAGAPVAISFGDISQAAFRIQGGVGKTTVHRSRKLSQLLGATIYCKNEFEHPTGSFKERGSRNALLQVCVQGTRRWSAACRAQVAAALLRLSASRGVCCAEKKRLQLLYDPPSFLPTLPRSSPPRRAVAVSSLPALATTPWPSPTTARSWVSP